MKSSQITFGRYQVYHTPVVTRSIFKKKKIAMSRLRRARPFILFDLAVIAGLLFLYLVQNEMLPIALAAFFPYVFVLFLLGKIRAGFGGPCGRCVAFAYLSVFIFFATVAALALLIELNVLHIIGIVGSVCLLLVANCILLPLHLDCVRGSSRRDTKVAKHALRLYVSKNIKEMRLKEKRL